MADNDGQRALRTLLRDVFSWSAAAAAYYLILRVFFYAQIKSTDHDIMFTWKQLWLNITTFLPQATLQIFNLWDVYGSKAPAISVIVLILGTPISNS